MSSPMSIFVIVGTILSMIACFWLIVWTNRQRQSDAELQESESHVWDGNIRELNNPLPMWWLYLFVITLMYSAAYLIVYPGLGNFAGTFGWSQIDQYEREVAAAEERYGPMFAEFGAMEVEQLINEPRAMSIGQSLYANYCAQCHGSTATGAVGFPNLTDDDWLWGDQPAQIEHAILAGRSGIMPSLSAVLGDELDEMVEYVRSMADGVDTSRPIHAKYVTFCGACHGPTGTGNALLGGPNLTDDIWLYGSSSAAVRDTIVNGRNGVMPAHESLIGRDRARILAAYVYSLSGSTGD